MEGLDLALRHDPRLLFRLVVLCVLGLAAVVGLGYLGTYLAPPHGLRVFGESLGTWGLIVLVALLTANAGGKAARSATLCVTRCFFARRSSG